MKIEVDLDLCQGHGMCEMEAPDLFEAERESVKLLDSQPDSSHLADVERAVRYCPTQALRIVEE
ncbi:ferredoxin [Williamsia limnetica]|jgi:ferredoxin|uniref:Ferredoxin n=1 Tax=Williamsia limnetica TaxID=882452 RepID=A0A318RE06_WILLI|nr:ferredoxin [Williamsia limnetica]PYE12178.1 ferredoxin [Williamsia limnetica]